MKNDMKKNNSWMYGIIGVFVGFATLMVIFAVMASHLNTNLVVNDYYSAELDYQKQVEKLKNYNALADKPVFRYDSLNRILILKMSNSGRYAGLSGKLNFYRPENMSRDYSVALKPDEKGRQIFDLKTTARGRWTLKLDWQEDGVGYYTEQKIKL
jgi:nitrogen fixation protein FixH